jgi:four helix bundle protein
MAVNLEDRLIAFVGITIKVCENLNYSEVSKHLKSQLLRSATSAALNFGEARSSESDKDLRHKLSVILKELRESYINLKIMKMNSLCKNRDLLIQALDENNQLISIFVKSIQTVRNRQ